MVSEFLLCFFLTLLSLLSSWSNVTGLSDVYLCESSPSSLTQKYTWIVYITECNGIFLWRLFSKDPFRTSTSWSFYSEIIDSLVFHLRAAGCFRVPAYRDHWVFWGPVFTFCVFAPKPQMNYSESATLLISWLLIGQLCLYVGRCSMTLPTKPRTGRTYWLESTSSWMRSSCCPLASGILTSE